MNQFLWVCLTMRCSQKSIFADYREHCQAIRALFMPDCNVRILFFKGEAGCGKSKLMEYARESAPAHVVPILISLKYTPTLIEFYSKICTALSSQILVQFTKQVAMLTEMPAMKIKDNWQVGIIQRIAATLNVEKMTDRRDRQILLAGALFADLVATDQIILFLVDAFECATTEMQAWLRGPFLARLAQTPNLRAAVTGQNIPKPDNIEWAQYCDIRELRGIRNVQDWLPVLDAVGAIIDDADPRSYIKGVCDLLNGNPRLIMDFVTTLARQQ